VAKTFVDTNVFLYSIDRKDPRKQAIAKRAIQQLVASRELVISTQVLQEFFVSATRKLGYSPIDAKALLKMMASNEVVPVDLSDLETAVDLTIVHSFSFWDALIFVSAAKSKCASLLTEDLQNGFVLNGVKVVNPF